MTNQNKFVELGKQSEQDSAQGKSVRIKYLTAILFLPVRNLFRKYFIVCVKKSSLMPFSV